MARKVQHPDNPLVFFEISIGDQHVGTINMELFQHVVPRTSENFRQFCTGEHKRDGVPVGYKKCCFHEIVKDFFVHGGDFIKNNGTGIYSIYNGKPFEDESFRFTHNKAGLLTMANEGPNTNGCQFFITTAPCDFLDNKHVVFGHVFDEDMHILRKIEYTPVGPQNKPLTPVMISECGEM